jgi:hypothetical protein
LAEGISVAWPIIVAELSATVCDNVGNAPLRLLFENLKSMPLIVAMQKSHILKPKCEPFCALGCGGETAWKVSGSGGVVQNSATFAPKTGSLRLVQNAIFARRSVGLRLLSEPELLFLFHFWLLWQAAGLVNAL